MPSTWRPGLMQLSETDLMTHTHTHTNTHTHTQIMESKTKESKGKQQYKDLEKLNRVIYYH